MFFYPILGSKNDASSKTEPKIINNNGSDKAIAPKKSSPSFSKPLMTRNSVESNCKKIIEKLRLSSTLHLKHNALQELCNYMLIYPESITILNRENTIRLLLAHKGLKDESTENLTR